MSSSKVFQIIPIVITLLGAAYMSYAESKGIADDYAWWVMGFGLALSFYNLLFMTKEKNAKG